MFIRSPTDPALDQLCDQLARSADVLDSTGAWPREQLDLCYRAGVLRWFLPPQWEGAGWSDLDILRAYIRLSAACLSMAFVLTQPAGACRRILASENKRLQNEVLPAIASGEHFASVGISHLTTSRQHLARPMMSARPSENGYVLEGTIPWVTGGPQADWVVTGATLADGRQILLLLPTDLPGVFAEPPLPLVGLSATHTGAIRCEGVAVDEQWLLAGPIERVVTQGGGAATGGLATSALAIGLADAAIRFLEVEAAGRPDLVVTTGGLRQEHAGVEHDLFANASGAGACSPDLLRSRANSLALRASQSALAAAKGSGYVAGHPAGRWCREALFFLVWSCPPVVMRANLCELAGLSSEAN